MRQGRPPFRIQVFIQTWTRDNQPKDPQWITIGFAPTLEDAKERAKAEAIRWRKSRIQKFSGSKYQTIGD